ncbi:MAG: phosphatase PAP2 family protein [Propionibacteriales bacterium]|nr:phosphatase PAP2 family protein [Propionibacteriales bacterium]
MARQIYGLAVALAVAMAILSVAASVVLDLPLRDPEGFLGPSWIRLPAILAVGFLLDVLPRGFYRARGFRGVVRHVLDVVSERWTFHRISMVVAGVTSFYLTYVSYRNLKSFLPWIREHTYDDALAEFDRLLTFGYDPAGLLHSVLGTGVSAHVLSFFYVGYLVFVPITLAAWLVWSRNVAAGLWYCTALCVNWALGVASYYIIPSWGPVFVEPAQFRDLPHTGVTELQTALWDSQYNVITDPNLTESVRSIAGFASLHVSVVFAAALITHLTVRNATIRWSLWAYFGLTVLATIYFGWHYIADDIAGVGIGCFSVWVSAVATGHHLHGNRRGSIFGAAEAGEPPEATIPVKRPAGAR